MPAQNPANEPVGAGLVPAQPTEDTDDDWELEEGWEPPMWIPGYDPTKGGPPPTQEHDINRE